jgi:hypothetical protein
VTAVTEQRVVVRIKEISLISSTTFTGMHTLRNESSSPGSLAVREKLKLISCAMLLHKSNSICPLQAKG